MRERTDKAEDGRVTTGGLTGVRAARPAALTVDDAKAAAEDAVALVKEKLGGVVRTDR
jgi:hypothetical protein